MDHCTSQQTRLAIDLLSDKINAESGHPVKVKYDPFLIVRNSTAKARSFGK
jgi:DNA-binding LacI/PurR family transcriptional regulator